MRFVRTFQANVTAHYTMLVAAGVAFYGALALVPALIAVVAVYGLVASPEGVQQNLEPLTEVLPTAAGDLIVRQLESVTQADDAQVGAGLAVGFAGVLWLVSGAVNALVMGIRIAHERKSPHSWLRGRLYALALAGAAVLTTALVLLLVIAGPELLAETPLGSTIQNVLRWLRWPVVILFSATMIAALYGSVLGHRVGARRTLTAGTLTATIVWVGGTILMGTFATNVDQLEATFGTLGAVAVLLAWLYLTAIAILFGAEIDNVLHGGSADLPDAQRHLITPEDAAVTGEIPVIEIASEVARRRRGRRGGRNDNRPAAGGS